MFFHIFGKDGKRNGDGLPCNVQAEKVADVLARDPQFVERVANLVGQECLGQFVPAMNKTVATWQHRTHGLTNSTSNATSKPPN